MGPAGSAKTSLPLSYPIGSAARALIPGVFYPFDELLRDLRRPIAIGTRFPDSNPRTGTMWFVALDLVLLALGELYALILDDTNTDLGEGLVLG